MNRDKVISQAIKLLRLSENNPSPEEAASAAAMAQALLDRYGIERAMLDRGLDDDPTEDEPICKQGELQRGAVTLWRQRLADVLSRANGCQIYVSRIIGGSPKDTTLNIVGRKSDAQTVCYLFDAVIRQMNHLVRLKASGMGRVYSNNYRHGVIDAIKTKLDEQKIKTVETIRSEHTGTALVKIDQAIAKWKKRADEADSWMHENFNLGKARGGSIIGNRGARAAGRRDGAGINVGRASGALGAPARRIGDGQ